jgi:hypothetical protein
MRFSRKLTDVVAEVKLALEAEFGVTDEMIAGYRRKVDANGHEFPQGSTQVEIDKLYIDLEVQRSALPKHIWNIMKNYDPRLCGPASACRLDNAEEISTYDGQQRSCATALLGFKSVPCNIVNTDDPAFASYAFEMLNETGVKRLTPGDLHRNALTRHRLGSRELKNILARTLQDQFDKNDVDLEDKKTRASNRRGPNDYFYSHFKHAYKAIELDNTGETLNDILSAIRNVFPLQEEIDQGCFIGLYELARLDTRQNLPAGWMIEVLQSAKKFFSSSATVHSKAKQQHAWAMPGATWSSPSNMSNFLRELHIVAGGEINLPYHGEGSMMQVQNNPVTGLFPNMS